MARIALALTILLSFGAPVVAQDAIPETPPELRDFRLDPERAQPDPEPQVTPPPPVQTLPETAAPSSSEPPAQTRTQRTGPPARTAAPGTNVQGGAAPVPSTTDQSADAAATPVLPADAQPETIAPVATKGEVQAEPLIWWQIGGALGLAVLALLALRLLKRRRQAIQERPVAFEPVGEADKVREVEPLAAAKTVPAPTVIARATLTLDFIPDKATLSFTALTVKGQLRLINEGGLSAQNLRLRATLLSANAQQQQIIAAFHAGQFSVPEEPLGEAKAGERIAMDIEMSVPVAELQSFEVDSRRMMVPVMVADIAYEWDGGSDMVKLACLVGREAQPPVPKMRPFRLDRGPRSFAPLGQRPLYA
jgi:hypothetical protein